MSDRRSAFPAKHYICATRPITLPSDTPKARLTIKVSPLRPASLSCLQIAQLIELPEANRCRLPLNPPRAPPTPGWCRHLQCKLPPTSQASSPTRSPTQPGTCALFLETSKLPTLKPGLCFFSFTRACVTVMKEPRPHQPPQPHLRDAHTAPTAQYFLSLIFYMPCTAVCLLAQRSHLSEHHNGVLYVCGDGLCWPI